jgi:Flp pilus assembly protein RcpC/CpaB
MTTIGQTVFRFVGAVLLGAAATAIDQPSVIRAPARSSGDFARLTPAAPEQGTPITITPGKRAFSFPITGVDATAGAAQPNSRVDVVVVVGGNQDPKTVKLFMQNMRLLGIRYAPQYTRDGRQANALVATIEVTQEEAERLAGAQSSGELQLLATGPPVFAIPCRGVRRIRVRISSDSDPFDPRFTSRADNACLVRGPGSACETNHEATRSRRLVGCSRAAHSAGQDRCP